MLVLVPAPPCRRSTTISAASPPSASSWQARSMASALASSRAHAPRARLVRTQASLTVPKARASRCIRSSPASAKFSSARSVCAPCRLRAGTATSPRRSRSILTSSLTWDPSSRSGDSPGSGGRRASVAEHHLLDADALDGVEPGHHRRGLFLAAEELDEHDAARRATAVVDVVQTDARLDVAAVLGEHLLHVHGVLEPVAHVDAEDDVVVVHDASSLVRRQQSTSRSPARTLSSIFWVWARRTSSISRTCSSMSLSPISRVPSVP